MRDLNVLMEILKQELALVRLAASSGPGTRAKKRQEFGLGPLYVFDEEVRKRIFEHREHYQKAKRETEQPRLNVLVGARLPPRNRWQPGKKLPMKD